MGNGEVRAREPGWEGQGGKEMGREKGENRLRGIKVG